MAAVPFVSRRWAWRPSLRSRRRPHARGHRHPDPNGDRPPRRLSARYRLFRLYRRHRPPSRRLARTAFSRRARIPRSCRSSRARWRCWLPSAWRITPNSPPTLALLVGLILVLAGVFRAGWVADLLSIPVVTGFLAGIAIHIAISQAPALLGLPGGEGEVFHRLALIGHDIGKTNFLTLAIGASCLACIVLFEKISPRIPGALIALAGATFVVAHFDLEARGVAVIGAFEFAPPHPAIPTPSLERSVACDRPRRDHFGHYHGADGGDLALLPRRSGRGAGCRSRLHRGRRRQRARRACSGPFRSTPARRAPPSSPRPAARSQFAGLVACAVVAAVAVYGAELLAHVPETALAGVLLFVAGRIFRVPDMLDIGGKSKAEFALVVVTMLGVVILPVQIGVALAIMLSLASRRLDDDAHAPHRIRSLARHVRLVAARSRLQRREAFRRAGRGVPGAAVLPQRLSVPAATCARPSLAPTAACGWWCWRRAASSRSTSPPRASFNDVIAQCRARGVDFALVRLESVRAQAALESFGVMATLGRTGYSTASTKRRASWRRTRR